MGLGGLFHRFCSTLDDQFICIVTTFNVSIFPPYPPHTLFFFLLFVAAFDFGPCRFYLPFALLFINCANTCKFVSTSVPTALPDSSFDSFLFAYVSSSSPVQTIKIDVHALYCINKSFPLIECKLSGIGWIPGCGAGAFAYGAITADPFAFRPAYFLLFPPCDADPRLDLVSRIYQEVQSSLPRDVPACAP
ncbi:hypothetical protein AG1IA_02714 [Rhizoctonia solani AG-1 IA]|uniref:Uncharacterized protein n=1 Tax=Thanatephorus cucumeris (strain AG1-IA) TaxID=983506 RepID=L8X3P6_THACA|nr:hypothetical protein AG1IA_02714 [Rhizoctonia solani AG-1 IA]